MNLNGPDLNYPFGDRSTLFAERSPAARSAAKNPSDRAPRRSAPGDWRYRPVRPRTRFPLVPLVVSAAAHAVAILGFNQSEAPRAPAAEEAPAYVEVHLKPLEPEEEPETPEPGAGEPAEELAGVDAPRLPEIITMVPIEATLTQALDYAAFLPRADLSSMKLMTVPGNYRAGGARGTAETLKSVFNLADLDRQPEALFQPVPHVPPGAKGSGISSARVVVEFVINAKGEVVSPSIVSSELAALNETALTGVLKWKFRPGVKGGRKVNTRMIQPMVFRFDAA